MSEELVLPGDAAEVAVLLSRELRSAECDFAIGGAIALGFWAEPRGTLDVDVTLYVDATTPDACVRVLEFIDCQFDLMAIRESLAEHGYCRVSFHGWQVDVFVPFSNIYAVVKDRRKRVQLLQEEIVIWDAESLCIFKMMFFRRKDLADVEQLLRAQGESFDDSWVEAQLEQIFGKRDPRVSTWQEIVAEVRA